MSVSHGIGDNVLNQIISTVEKYPQVERLLLYGSRARGEHITGSDIDLAIDAPGMEEPTFARLWNEIDDLPIIYTLDIVHLQGLSNLELLAEINKDAASLWQKAKA